MLSSPPFEVMITHPFYVSYTSHCFNSLHIHQQAADEDDQEDDLPMDSENEDGDEPYSAEMDVDSEGEEEEEVVDHKPKKSAKWESL